jgi:hypothetical protein
MIPAYERHSPSKLNLFCASPALFVLEYVKGIRQEAGPPAHRGVAVEDGVTHGLMHFTTFDPGDFDECVKVALATYDARTTLSGDPRRDRYRATIPDMVKTALDELLPYGRPSGMQGLVEWQPDGLQLPIVGYFDYQWDEHGILLDLKTSEKMPSSIKFSHARQVAHYAVSDNIDARLAYVTPKKLEVFRLENVRAHREALAQIARTVERFLSLSDDPDELLARVAPDLDSFYWTNPAMRQLAYEHWKI